MKKFAKKLSFNLQQGTKFTPPKKLLCEIKAMKLKYGGATKELFVMQTLYLILLTLNEIKERCWIKAS